MTLQDTCEAAARAGLDLDLTGCYHEIAGSYAFVPCTYYPLLAGLVRTQRLSQVLDVGTRFGGSILALRRGLVEGLPVRPVLVTVDLTEHPGHPLGSYPDVTRVLGDAAAPETADRVAARFQPPIDLVYLDAVHTREHTRACFDGYARRLNPRFVLIDDIYLNDSMKRMWDELLERFPAEQVFDATELTGRGAECGFGVIEFRKVQG